MPPQPPADDTRRDHDLRIVGGRFRGSKLAYHGDPVTRPMKHRVREAIFNLVGVESKGRHAMDLFGGTGALGLEALSRGAVLATFVEKHIPSSRVLRENIDSLGVEQCCELLTTSAFLWGKRDLPGMVAKLATEGKQHAWLVFVSPPYSFYVDRESEILTLIEALMTHAPPESIVVVEADGRFNFDLVESLDLGVELSARWDIRTYSPAVVGVWRKPKVVPGS